MNGSVNVTVNKATPIDLGLADGQRHHYGQTLASSTLSGGTASVAGSFAGRRRHGSGSRHSLGKRDLHSATRPTTHPVSGSVSVTVNKATPIDHGLADGQRIIMDRRWPLRR